MFYMDIKQSPMYIKYKELENIAKRYMKTKIGNMVLIEIAAQHPLIDKRYPNEEFKARLIKGIELYQSFNDSNLETKIYIPGSVHFDYLVSLSEAGKQFLIKQGIPEKDIYGDAENIKYTKGRGVFNSTDECFVASEIFKSDAFKKLYCVCSPAQLERKALSYLRFGCLPKFVSVSCDDMYHSFVDEAFIGIPSMLDEKKFEESMKSTRGIRNKA